MLVGTALKIEWNVKLCRLKIRHTSITHEYLMCGLLCPTVKTA